MHKHKSIFDTILNILLVTLLTGLFAGPVNVLAEETAEEAVFTKSRIDYEIIDEYSEEKGFGYVRITGNSLKSSVTSKSIDYCVKYDSKNYYVREIGDGAFLGSSLEEVVIPDTVCEIGTCAFYGSVSLTAVSLGENVEIIGSGAFAECPLLKSFVISESNGFLNEADNIIYNEKYTQLICGNAASGKITLPESVVKIDSYAFEGNNKITKVICNRGLKKIGEDAFYNCTALKTVKISDTVKSIKYNPFKYCTSLTKFVVDEANPYFSAADGMLLSKSGKTLYACPAVSGDIFIKAGIRNIDEFAFCGNKGVVSVFFPSGVKEIRNGAFYDCRNLKKISFESRKTRPVNESKSTVLPAFGNTEHYLNISLPYSKSAGEAGSVEAALKAVSPDGAIFISR